MMWGASLDVYERNWSGEKIQFDREAAKRLRRVPTIFRSREPRSVLPPHAGPFSIKAVASGATSYAFGRRSYQVKPGHLLVVPAGETYTTTVEDFAAIVTIYLPSTYISDAIAAIRNPDELDGGEGSLPDFATHIRRDECLLRKAIEHLAKTADAAFYSERLVSVTAAAAALVNDATGALSRINAAKVSTRRELFRRVSLARQRIEDRPHVPVTLDELAGLSALSRFHLLRAFVDAFGESPAQMRRRLCLLRAEKMLAERRLPISDIALEAGFENPSAFSRAFGRHAGMSPSKYRAR
jgi:AraC-like DNA-binding protein